MNLTGHILQGDNSFEVKEIAPPVESGQLLANNEFTNWTADDPDDWTVLGESGSDPMVTEVNGAARFYTSGSDVGVRQNNIFTVARYYLFKIYITDVTAGAIVVHDGVTVTTLSTTGYHEWTIKAAGTTFYIQRQAGATDVTVDWVRVIEVPEGYPLMEKEDEYFESTTNNSYFGIPFNKAYGTWEWSFYMGGVGSNSCAFFFTNLTFEAQPGISRGGSGYALVFDQDDRIRLREHTPASASDHMLSATSYFDINTWYRFKVTRTKDGAMTAYIKGGDFGYDDWTLITPDSGTNPHTDTTYTTSSYIIITGDDGDRVANITYTEGVEQ